MTRVALMLYSVRRAAEADFELTLREVAAMGYEGVELFDLHGRDPATVARWLGDLGLVAVGRHAGLEAIEAELPQLAAEAEALGWRRLVISWVNPAELDDSTLARIAAAASAAAAHGLELGYHNHDAEIEQGFLERLPAGVFVELDAGWAWYAGADPADYLGRGPLLHVKDFRVRGEHSFCPVGDGAVGFDRIVAQAAGAGVEWLIVEQDEPVGTELEDARRSLAAVITMLGEVV
ncbi:MAG TPA: sugar phosphate isomerase/epimerase [Gaiellales bacterium]|nr:sugar phosphate isomerase/epimerase [Gaiellales bacterium]